MAVPTRVDSSGMPSNLKSYFYIQAAAAALALDAPAADERYVITDVFVVGPATTFTIDLGVTTLTFGDHPGTGEPIKFPPGSVVGDKGSAVDIACAGATNMLALGYVVSDLI